MNILLRKLWILTSLILAANAETIFYLKSQHFQNAMGKDANGQNAKVIETPSRYNLPKVYVSTGLVQNKNGTYTLGENKWQDQFYVELKNPVSTWSVDFDASYYFRYALRTIKFISDTGQTITLGMSRYGFYFNSEVSEYTDNTYRVYLTGTVSMNGSKVTFDIDRMKEPKTMTVSNFSKLKYVSISILDDELGASSYYYDILNSLRISSSD